MTALEIFLEGRIQGVGFRPFVRNLATSHGVAGWVGNTAQGVTVHAEADPGPLRSFVEAMARDLPKPARIHVQREMAAEFVGYDEFLIRESDPSGEYRGSFLPDLCLCDSCRRELLNPLDRRFLHAFISCTHCGPRFSITKSLPYDRPATSMGEFPMCSECRAEYEDPSNRRFHAQPVCCPECGPKMWCELPSIDSASKWQIAKSDWLDLWVSHVASGGISLLKGMGGFHLACDATNSDSIRTLRERKRRETKPFAVMAPNLDSVRSICHVSHDEETLLTGIDRPIVLLDVHTPPTGLGWIAPGLSQLGVMLPHAPVHELFFSRFEKPIVLTSANRSSEPMITGNDQARDLAGEWCDLLVLHDRRIVNRLDDGVVAALPNSQHAISLRIGRGGSPMEFAWSGVRNCLATGADLKNTVALGHHGRVTMSQHIGDMEHPAAQDVAQEMAERLCASYRIKPEFLACDAHPEYHSSRLAARLSKAKDIPVFRIQHHHAHLAATWLEYQWNGDAIGFAMDGTGYGDPDCVWGSEVMHFTPEGSTTIGHFQGLRLPGGDLAVREPSRLLIGAIHDLADPNLLDAWLEKNAKHRSIYDGGLKVMLDAHLNCPFSRGLGRLFDLVGAMLGWPNPGWDGEMGTRLEHLDKVNDAPSWPIELEGDQILFAPLLRAALIDALNGADPQWVSSRLHASVCELIVRLGLHAETRVSESRHNLPWAFAGGVFQNRKILERLQNHPEIRSRKAFFSSIPNDNGIALGQIVAATALANKGLFPCV